MLSANLKTFVINWNNSFPLDRWFREKYNIPFNSKKHQKASQADILIEYIEELMHDEYDDKYKQKIENDKLLEKGEWIKEARVSEEDLDEAFDKIDI